PAGHLRGTSALLDHPNKNLRPKVRPALGDPRHLRLKRRRRKRPESRTAQRPAADGIFSRIAQKKSAGPTVVKPQKCRHVKTPGLCGVLTPVFYRRQLV